MRDPIANCGRGDGLWGSAVGLVPGAFVGVWKEVTEGWTGKGTPLGL